MKLDKVQQKQLMDEIAKISSEKRYNSKKNTIYFAKDNAFKAPSILLNKGEIELGDNYVEQAQYLITLIDESSCSFLEKYDIDDYVINLADGMYINILKYLAYIHMNNEFEANIIAKEAVNDNAVDFINEGKSFFEWALTE